MTDFAKTHEKEITRLLKVFNRIFDPEGEDYLLLKIVGYDFEEIHADLINHEFIVTCDGNMQLFGSQVIYLIGLFETHFYTMELRTYNQKASFHIFKEERVRGI